MSDISDWFKRLPFFTRWWLVLTVGFTLCGRFGILKPYHLYLLYEPFIKQFQVRPHVKLRLTHVKLIINRTQRHVNFGCMYNTLEDMWLQLKIEKSLPNLVYLWLIPHRTVILGKCWMCGMYACTENLKFLDFTCCH
jgi:hypothetical protein